MGIAYSGTDVRIGHDQRVWVLVPAGILGRDARWKAVEQNEITLDAGHPVELISPYARHPVADLGLDVIRLSHLLGLPRKDPRRVRQLWSAPQTLRPFSRQTVAIDLERQELAGAPDALWVWPFSAVAGITASPPRLLLRPHPTGDCLELSDLPVDPARLAEALGVELHADR